MVPIKLTEGKIPEQQSRVNQLWVKYSFKKTKNVTSGGFAFKLDFKNKGMKICNTKL